MANEEILQEEETSVITFVDENGEEIEMEYLDCIEYEGKEYLALLPAEEGSNEVVILEINPEQQRISLGLKQAENDPWSNINDLYKVGDIVKGSVTKITTFGAFVELSNKIDGLIHISQLSNERVDKVKDVLKVGDDVEARVIKVDTDERRIGLSIKAVDGDFSEADLKAAEEEYTAALKPGEAMVNIGEVFESGAMDALKLD
jgi:small subunit ribosomal protein S1